MTVTPYLISLHASGGRTTHTDMPLLRRLLEEVALELGEPVVGRIVSGGFSASRCDELDLTVRAGFRSSAEATRAGSALLRILSALSGSTIGRALAVQRPDLELASSRPVQTLAAL
jgi:hypothetical protein